MRKPWSRKPAFDTYTPPRVDSRIEEARSMLQNRGHMRGMEANGLRCQFNLKMSTAERLIAEEQARRG